MRYI